MKIFEEKLDGKERRFAIVVSRFNQHVTDRLLESAQQTLLKAGVCETGITVVFVPGAFEIPAAVDALARTKNYDAVIALGCVLRGETLHFDVLCHSTAQALHQITLQTQIPVTMGIVMAENEEQAMDRAGGKIGNRGEEAARAAVEIINVLKRCADVRMC